MSPENNTEPINIEKNHLNPKEIPKMMISDEELASERIPLSARDYCSHLLVTLNRCKRKNLYLPFRCTEEKHEYEQCQYKERSKIYRQEREKEIQRINNQ